MVDIAKVWEVLATVPDPEIPTISLVDLGIVRSIDWEKDVLIVKITPTYSGCPATAVITQDIKAALTSHGIDKFDVQNVLYPPWTTDWMKPAAHAKLKEYGISPPVRGADVTCPQCGSKNTQKVSQFGSTPCKSSYRCADCLEPFDHFKCI